MLKALELFEIGIKRVRNIDSIYAHLTTNLGFSSQDISDLLRTEIVYCVSSFDRFIHDIVNFAMVETFKNNRTPTNAYKNFNITLSQFESINKATIPPAEHIFSETVISSHKHLSFQDPSKVVEALSLIWLESHKWQKIALTMSMNENDVKTELKNIVIRRNQIVHEGDFDLLTGSMQLITHSDTLESVNFIENLGKAIYNLVK